jgi:cation:H+ antiporter
MFSDIALVLIGFGGLVLGGNWLVRGAARLAGSLGVSSLVVGLTVVALGTSMPELMVSLSAALAGTSDIALGNVIGSNIANIGLILGLAAIIRPIQLYWVLIRRETWVMLVATAGAIFFAVDGQISSLEGILLLLGAGAFIFLSYRWAMGEKRVQEDFAAFEESRGLDVQPEDSVNRLLEVGYVLAGIAALVLAANALVTGAGNIALALGVSKLVIGLLLVAVGTSLPELVTTVIAANKGQSDIAVGNVVGSNILNIFVILGATSAVRPIAFGFQTVLPALAIMAGFTVLVPVLLRVVGKDRIGRAGGLFLLAAYVVYSLFTFLQNG